MKFVLILAVLGLSGCATNFRRHCMEDGGVYALTPTVEVCMKQVIDNE
jgi:uncharacterized protein YceK